MVKKDIIVSVYFVKPNAQTDTPGETQEVEQEGREIFYLVVRMMSNNLPGIQWHLRFKVKLYF